jgi:hypothetical protein
MTMRVPLLGLILFISVVVWQLRQGALSTLSGIMLIAVAAIAVAAYRFIWFERGKDRAQ